jgi:transposase
MPKEYKQEFRENAVRLSMVPGKKVSAVAHELGISINTLHDWRRQHRKTAAPPSQETLQQQNRRLRRELDALREEAAILKKAIAYFAQPPKK